RYNELLPNIDSGAAKVVCGLDIADTDAVAAGEAAQGIAGPDPMEDWAGTTGNHQVLPYEDTVPSQVVCLLERTDIDFVAGGDPGQGFTGLDRMNALWLSLE